MKKVYKSLIILIIVLSLPIHISACMFAHIYKIFPVGMSGDTIISVDIDIWRNGDMVYFEGQRKSSITFDGLMPSDMGWDIKTYITKYDKHQNPIEIKVVDSTYFQSYDYQEQLQILYTRAFDKILENEKHIELFEPIDIAFCNQERKLKGLKQNEDKANFIYKGKEYDIPIAQDSTYLPFKQDTEYRELMMDLPPIISVRKYKTEKIELVVAHLQIGQLFTKFRKPDRKSVV